MAQNCKIQLSDLSGKVIETKLFAPEGNNFFDLQTLSNGTYLLTISNKTYQETFNPHYALELRHEGQKCNKISRFIDFSIAPLW